MRATPLTPFANGHNPSTAEQIQQIMADRMAAAAELEADRMRNELVLKALRGETFTDGLCTVCLQKDMGCFRICGGQEVACWMPGGPAYIEAAEHGVPLYRHPDPGVYPPGLGPLRVDTIASNAAPQAAFSGPTVITACQLQDTEFPEPRLAVGFIPEGVSLLVGPPKVGKSWMALELLAAAAAGGQALGFTHCQPGRALYLALEDGDRRIKGRLQKHLGAQRWPSTLHLATSWRRFDDGGLADLDTWLTEHGDTRLVVVDTLARVRPRERPAGGVYSQDYQALAPLADIARNHHVAVIVIHHTRKMGSDDVLDLVSGSNGLAGAVDAVLILQRARLSDDGVLTLTGRDIEERSLACHFDGDSCRWTIEGDAGAVQISRLQKEILQVLEEGELQAREIADRIGHENDSSLRHILSRMVKAGLALITRRGRYSLPAKPLPIPEETGEDMDAENCDFVTCDLVTFQCESHKPHVISAAEDHKVTKSQSHKSQTAAPPAQDEITKSQDHKVTNGKVLTMSNHPCPSCGKYHSAIPTPGVPGHWHCRHCGIDRIALVHDEEF